MTVIRPGMDANALYLEAISLKAQGDCAAATPKLRIVAGRGPGYENAQTALGECLIQGAPADAEPSVDFQEGMAWLRRAGDAGWPEAQGALARVYALGPQAVHSGEDAGYWLALYESNYNRSRIGFTPLSAADLSAIDKALSAAEKAAGARHAATWARKVWLPPPESTEPVGSNMRQQQRRN